MLIFKKGDKQESVGNFTVHIYSVTWSVFIERIPARTRVSVIGCFGCLTELAVSSNLLVVNSHFCIILAV